MKTAYLEVLHTDEITQSRTTGVLPRRCRQASREELERLESGVSAQVLLSSADESRKPVPLRYMGRTILAQPLDTRRFIREMAVHICFN